MAGQHFKILLIILVSLFIVEREIKTITLSPAAMARGGAGQCRAQKFLALEPDGLASFLDDPLCHFGPWFPVKQK